MTFNPRMGEIIPKRPYSNLNGCHHIHFIFISYSLEESGMLGDIQGGFRMGRRTEDNLFILERMIEMAKVRKDCLFVAFIDMEKAYDRVNRKKLFEVMRGYGVQGILVDVYREDL